MGYLFEKVDSVRLKIKNQILGHEVQYLFFKTLNLKYILILYLLINEKYRAVFSYIFYQILKKISFVIFLINFSYFR